MAHNTRLTDEETLTELKRRLETGFDNAQVRVAGGGGHFALEIISPVFEGMSTLNKQRAVYDAIGDLMKGDDAPIHAMDQMIIKAV
jgi:acid stress-induced BolA-like protein IbaG/YrbA